MTKSNIPPTIKNLRESADRYDAYIIDIWGVLHDGRQVFDGVIPTLKAMKDQGKEILFLSNSPNRAAYVASDNLAPMGITKDLYDHILTSGEATWEFLHDYQNQSFYMFWGAEKPTAAQGHDVRLTLDIEDADFMLGSLFPKDAQVSDYEDTLKRALERGLPFICANPDKVVHFGPELCICAGAVADRYEEMGGQVHWFGKPYAPVYEKALSMLNTDNKRRILAIGDSLRTDVKGANDFGIDVYWKLTGIHWEELGNPDMHEFSITRSIAEYDATPDGILLDLLWQ